jgi:hypothetical protein
VTAATLLPDLPVPSPVSVIFAPGLLYRNGPHLILFSSFGSGHVSSDRQPTAQQSLQNNPSAHSFSRYSTFVSKMKVTCTETRLNNNAHHSVATVTTANLPKHLKPVIYIDARPVGPAMAHQRNANEKSIAELVAQYEWKQETSLNLTDRLDIVCTLEEIFGNTVHFAFECETKKWAATRVLQFANSAPIQFLSAQRGSLTQHPNWPHDLALCFSQRRS